MKKATKVTSLVAFESVNGRRGGIRTRDPLHPMQVRYQAALHAEARILARRLIGFAQGA